MSDHTLSRYRHVQLQLIHQLSFPLHRLFSMLPAWEYGLEKPAITKILCSQTPLAARTAVQLSDLHLDPYLPRHDTVLAQISELKPDCIIVTGDLPNTPAGIPPRFRRL